MTDEHKPGRWAVLAVLLIVAIATLSFFILHDSPENTEPVPALPIDLNDILK